MRLSRRVHMNHDRAVLIRQLIAARPSIPFPSASFGLAVGNKPTFNMVLSEDIIFVSLGMVVLDELRFPDGQVLHNVGGGSALYSPLPPSCNVYAYLPAGC